MSLISQIRFLYIKQSRVYIVDVCSLNKVLFAKNYSIMI